MLCNYNVKTFLQDLRGAVKKVADFLGKSLSEDQIQRIVHYLGIDEMKKNSMVNFDILKDLEIYKKDDPFIRKG